MPQVISNFDQIARIAVPGVNPGPRETVVRNAAGTAWEVARVALYSELPSGVDLATDYNWTGNHTYTNDGTSVVVNSTGIEFSPSQQGAQFIRGRFNADTAGNWVATRIQSNYGDDTLLLLVEPDGATDSQLGFVFGDASQSGGVIWDNADGEGLRFYTRNTSPESKPIEFRLSPLGTTGDTEYVKFAADGIFSFGTEMGFGDYIRLDCSGNEPAIEVDGTLLLRAGSGTIKVQNNSVWSRTGNHGLGLGSYPWEYLIVRDHVSFYDATTSPNEKLQGSIEADWIDPTDALRTGKLTVKVADFNEPNGREAIRIEAEGSRADTTAYGYLQVIGYGNSTHEMFALRRLDEGAVFRFSSVGSGGSQIQGDGSFEIETGSTTGTLKLGNLNGRTGLVITGDATRVGIGKQFQSPESTLHVMAANSGEPTTVYVDASASQSTSPLQQWRQEDGAVLASMSATGGLTLNGGSGNGIMFGDGDTGFYEDVDTLNLITGGTSRWKVNNSQSLLTQPLHIQKSNPDIFLLQPGSDRGKCSLHFGCHDNAGIIKSSIVASYDGSGWGRSDLHLCTINADGFSTPDENHARLTIKSAGQVQIKGPATEFLANTSTSLTSVGSIVQSWTDSTHATRTGKLTVNVADYNEPNGREAVSFESDGSKVNAVFSGEIDATATSNHAIGWLQIGYAGGGVPVIQSRQGSSTALNISGLEFSAGKISTVYSLDYKFQQLRGGKGFLFTTADTTHGTQFNRLLVSQNLTAYTDLIFDANTDGVILKDRTTGTSYRLYVDGGSLSIEAV